MQEWDRVTGTDLDAGKVERAKLNQGILKSQVFLDACEKTGARPTRKQASKYRRKKGKAFLFWTADSHTRLYSIVSY